MKKITTARISKTSGNETISSSEEVFDSYIDSDFKNWNLDAKSKDAKESDVDVYEMNEDGTFKQLFDSLSRDTDSLCLTQGQIVEFCRSHRESLRQDGWGTFFLFKVGGEFFVASVRVTSDGLEVGARRFSGEIVWRADGRHRIVVPQLTSGTSGTGLTPGSSETLTLAEAIRICKKNGLTVTKTY